MNTRHALAAIVIAAAFALTACTGSGSSDNPATTTVIETAPDPDSEDMTQTVIDLSWDQQTEADKNSMCDGISLFGPDWAAEQMQLGAGDTTGIDWDQAAQLVEAKCALR